MSPLTCIFVLAATLASGGAGCTAAVLVARITRAPHLRYLAYTTALILSPIPLFIGVPMAGTSGVAHARLASLAPVAVLRFAAAPSAHGWLVALAKAAPSLLTVYAAGAATCFLRLGSRWAALGRIVRAARPVDPRRLGERSSSLPVRVTDGLTSAVLIGVRRPVVVLPERILAVMTGAQLDWVLAHEAAHARKGDNLRLVLEATLRAALWFNPFVAWAATQAAEAREQLRDAAVLRGADADYRRAYAETLLLAFRLGARSQVASSLITPGRRRLLVRFETILHPAEATFGKVGAAIGLVVAASLLAGVAGAAVWAQAPTPTLAPVDGPVDFRADRLVTSGCEYVWLGNVTVTSQTRSLKADALRVLAAANPHGCGRLLTGEAYGNVVLDGKGRIERGQVAHIDFRTSSIAVK